jgi:hypothetical protein
MHIKNCNHLTERSSSKFTVCGPDNWVWFQEQVMIVLSAIRSRPTDRQAVSLNGRATEVCFIYILRFLNTRFCIKSTIVRHVTFRSPIKTHRRFSCMQVIVYQIIRRNISRDISLFLITTAIGNLNLISNKHCPPIYDVFVFEFCMHF